MSWFALALAAGLASAANVHLSRALLRSREHPVLIGGIVHLLGGVLTLAALPFVPTEARFETATLFGLALMTGVYTLGNALYFQALRRVPLSEIDLLLRSSSLWTFVGGIVLLAEPVRSTAVAGAVLVFASLLMLSRTPSRLAFTGPQWLALGAAVCFGVGNVIDKALSPSFDPTTYTILNLILTGVGMAAIAGAGPRRLLDPTHLQPAAWAVGLTFAVTQLLLIAAFRAGGGAGEVIVVAQIRLAILMAIGFGVLGEREAIGRKLVAGTLMVAGVFLFSRLS